MKKLNVSNDLKLPLDMITSTSVVYGGKGMGKSVLAAVVAEEVWANNQRFSYFDPVGVGYGLQRAGEREGIECLVLGGAHGDIPIEPTAGAVVADLVVDEDVCVVIDVSRSANGRMWSNNQKIRFAIDYFTRLYERQGEQRRPLLQIIDEAGRFVPQVIPKHAAHLAECVGAIEQLVELGRNVAVGVMLVTQRSARMNKSVSELADTMFAFRTIGPHSLAAIMDWCGDNRHRVRKGDDLEERLRSLDPGQALVISPGWLKFEGVINVRMRHTFDASSTPKPGQTQRRPGKASKPDLSKYKERMAETVEKAEADDPKALKAKVTKLGSDLSKALAQLQQLSEAKTQAKPGKTLKTTETIRVVEPVLVPDSDVIIKLSAEVNTRLEDLEARFELATTALKKAFRRELDNADKALAAAKRAKPTSTKATIEILAEGKAQPTAAPLRTIVLGTSAAPAENPPAGVGKAHYALLRALHHYGAMPLETAALIALYVPTNRHIQIVAGELRSQGLITGNNAMMTITGSGQDVARASTAPLAPHSSELFDAWVAQLSTPQGKLLQAVLELGGCDVSLQDSASRAGYEASNRHIQIVAGELRSRGMITGNNKSMTLNAVFLPA